MSEEDLLQQGYRIIGRVQGVFFRAWTQEFAQELGIVGTVRNLPDGSVEAHALGKRLDLEVFERGLWDGPPAAIVNGVELFESQEVLVEGSFRILY